VSGTTSVPRPTFGAFGFILPSEQDVLIGRQADIDAAMGGGLNPALETPQGQLASSDAAIIGDCNDQFLQVVLGVDPLYADGRMQDGIARIYFLTRKPATATQVQATCGGLPGVIIPSGALAKATDGTLYTSQGSGTIGVDGTVTMTFAAVNPGPIACATGALTTIYRAVNGWDTITNNVDGVLGTATETRTQFELRRQQSVAKNSVGSIPAIQGSVLEVPGILDAYTTDNSTGSNVVLDGVTLPANSLYVCVSGGDPLAIATAIWKKKMPGGRMAGNTSVTVLDTDSRYSPPYPSYSITYQTAVAQEFLFLVTLAGSLQVPGNAATLIRAVILSAFAGADGGSRARIGSTVFASRFYAGIAALGPWVEIISIKLGSTGAPKATFAASISGTVMTVTAISQGVVAVGQTVIAGSVASGVTIVSRGSGTGGTGTYNLNIAQTAASQQMYGVVADLDLVQVGIAHVPVTDEGDVTVVLA
jgi:hypothetical protein